MPQIAHIFKSYCSIFLFKLFELWNLAFGLNQSWVRFGVKFNFKYTRAHLSACPSSPSVTCRSHGALTPHVPGSTSSPMMPTPAGPHPSSISQNRAGPCSLFLFPLCFNQVAAERPLPFSFLVREPTASEQLAALPSIHEPSV
jgi:hypothetical protein